MRDRNEATPDAAGASLVPIPIGLVPLIKVVKIRKTSKRANIFKLGVHTKTMMAWKPKELHRFWRRMLGGNDAEVPD